MSAAEPNYPPSLRLRRSQKASAGKAGIKEQRLLRTGSGSGSETWISGINQATFSDNTLRSQGNQKRQGPHLKTMQSY